MNTRWSAIVGIRPSSRGVGPSPNYENLVLSWSRDGKSIYFASNRTGVLQIWRYELASGRETQVTRRGGFAGFESYDGKTLYFSKFDGAGVWRVPVTGGDELRVTNSPHLGYWGHFAVVEDGLYLVDADAKRGPSILYYSFQTRNLISVLTFKKGQHAVPWTGESKRLPRRPHTVLRSRLLKELGRTGRPSSIAILVHSRSPGHISDAIPPGQVGQCSPMRARGIKTVPDFNLQHPTWP
jgi:hypothetical protein